MNRRCTWACAIWPSLVISIVGTQVLGDSVVKSWGWNQWAQLGQGDHDNIDAPTQIAGLTNVVKVACGDSHTLFLLGDGTVMACGLNSLGQLGTGVAGGSSTVPVPVINLTGITAISAGYRFSAALKSDGTVCMWGDNSLGYLGNTSAVGLSATPVKVHGLTNVISISCGMIHTVAVQSNSLVWSWGYNWYGQFNNSSAGTVSGIPVVMANIFGAVEVAAGAGFTVVRQSSGLVRTCGAGDAGQLGHGSFTTSSTPVFVGGISTAVAVAAGGGHAMAILADGTVQALQAWGANSSGQLGVGKPGNLNFPEQVVGLSGITAICGGANHSMARNADGVVWAWGDNTFGELGDGSFKDAFAPVLAQIPALAFGAGTQCSVVVAPAPLNPLCVADIAPAKSPDGAVSVPDLLAVIDAWGEMGISSADVSGNGVVNVADLLAVITAWGPCP